MIHTQPWHIDASLSQTSPITDMYTLVPGGKADYARVTALYQRSPISGYSWVLSRSSITRLLGLVK